MMHKQLVGIWLWPELLLVSSFIITPAIAQHLPGDNNNSTIVHCYDSVVSEVATASSSFSAVVTPTSTVFFDTAFNDACYALAAISSETSSSPASKLVRPTAGSIPGARSSPRTYDEKQALKNDYRPLDNTTQVPLELQDNHGFKFTSSGTEWIGRLPVDVTARLPGVEGSGLFDSTFFSAADAGDLRCQPQVQRLVNFSTGSLWGYSVDCGLSRLPLDGELDDHSNCSEAQIQHAQDVARGAGLERAWELAGIQDCQRVAGEREKERVERREKKRRGKKFLRNTLAFLVKQHKFDTAFIHSTAVTVYLPPLYPKQPAPPFAWPVPTTCPVLLTCPVPPAQPTSPSRGVRPMYPTGAASNAPVALAQPISASPISCSRLSCPVYPTCSISSTPTAQPISTPRVSCPIYPTCAVSELLPASIISTGTASCESTEPSVPVPPFETDFQPSLRSAALYWLPVILATVIRAYKPSLYLQINFPVFLLWIAAGKGLDASLEVLYQLVSSLPTTFETFTECIATSFLAMVICGLLVVLMECWMWKKMIFHLVFKIFRLVFPVRRNVRGNFLRAANDNPQHHAKIERRRQTQPHSDQFNHQYQAFIEHKLRKMGKLVYEMRPRIPPPAPRPARSRNRNIPADDAVTVRSTSPQTAVQAYVSNPVPSIVHAPTSVQAYVSDLVSSIVHAPSSSTEPRLEAPELPQSDTNTSNGTNEEAGCPNASATTEEAPTESSSGKVRINIAERVATSTTSNADDATELELKGDENDAAPSDLQAPERILDSVAQSSVTVESYPFADEDISPTTSVTEQSSPLSAAVSVDVISEAAEENKASSVSNFTVDEEEQADDGDDTSETTEEDVSSMIVISAVEAADAERHSNSSLIVSVDLEQDAASWSPAEKPSSDDPISAGCHSDEKNEVTMFDLSTKEAGVEEPHVEDTSSSDMSPEQIEEDVASTIDISAEENQATIGDSTASDDKEAGVEEPHVKDTSSSDMSPAQIGEDVASTIDRSAIEEEATVEDSTDRADTSNDTGEDMSSGVGDVEGADIQQEDAQQEDAQVQEPIQEPTSSHVTPEETVAELTSTSSPEVEAVLGLSISTGVESNTTEQLEVHTPSGSTSLSPAPIDAVFSDIVSEESVEVVRERPFRSKLFNADINPFNQTMEGDWEVTMPAASTTSDSTAENEAEATSTSSSSAVNEPRSEEPHCNDPTVTVHQSSPALTLETPASTVASAVRSIAWPLPSSGFTGFGIPPPSALGPTQPVISSSGLAFSFGGAGWSGLRDLTTAAPQTHTSASPPPRSAFAKRPKSERDAPVSTGPGSQTSASAFGTNSVFKPLASAAPTADPASALAAQTSAPSSTPVKQEDVTEPQPQSSTPPVDTLATDAPTVDREATQRTARPAKSLLASAMAKIKPVEKVFAPQVTNTSSDISVSQSTFATDPRAQVSPPAQQDSARLHPSIRQNNTDNRVPARSEVLHQSNNSAIPSIHQRSTEAEIDDAMQKIVLQMSGKVLTNPFAGPTQPPEVPAVSTSARRPDLARPPRAKPSTTSSTAPTEQEIRDREVMREYREFLDAEPAVANRANEVHRALAAAASSPVGTARNARRPVQAPAQHEPTVVVYGRDPYATQPVEPVVNVAEDQSPKGESNARRGMYRGNRAGGKVQKRNQNRMAKMAAGENGGDCTAGAGMNR